VIIGQFTNEALGTRLSPGAVNDRRSIEVDSSSHIAQLRNNAASRTTSDNALLSAATGATGIPRLVDAVTC